LTKTGQFVGTVDYIAPEQVDGGPVDARTDVYSLGCVLYHLLTGRVPYEKPSEMAKLFAHVHEEPPMPSAHAGGLPPELDAVVARGMAKHPSDRWLSAGDLGRAALAAAQHRAVDEPERTVASGEARPVTTVLSSGNERAGPPRRRRLLIGAAVALLAAAAAVAIAALAVGGGDSEQSGTSSGGAVTSGGAAALSTADAVNKVYDYADDFSDACLSCLEESFTQDFQQTDTRRTCSGAKQPMALDVALADYTCAWQIRQAEMKPSGITVDVGKRTASASYTLVYEGKQTGSGKFTVHFVPVSGQAPLIDRVRFSAG
jgi:hypothetical protein